MSLIGFVCVCGWRNKRNELERLRLSGELYEFLISKVSRSRSRGGEARKQRDKFWHAIYRNHQNFLPIRCCRESSLPWRSMWKVFTHVVNFKWIRLITVRVSRGRLEGTMKAECYLGAKSSTLADFFAWAQAKWRNTETWNAAAGLH